MVPIHNIIWDWNGTLVDDAWVFVKTMNHLLQKTNLPPTSLEDYKKNFCFPVETYWKKIGFSLTEDEFNKKNAFFIKQYQKRMFLPLLHPGIKNLLFSLNRKKIQQFVLSASEHSLLQKSIQHYGLRSLFIDCLGVNNLNAKGKESLGKKLLNKHNLNNKHTLFIGDTEYDVRVGEALDCRVVLVSFGHISHTRLLKTKKPVFPCIKELSSFLLSNQ
tara:strand:+ start:577 stop:1227 length:651 start_codon:yes stop_codon:yes gene_type:complete